MVVPKEDAQKIPEWLTAEKFENHLKQNVPGYKRTIDFKAYPALAPGENYATLMLRVELELELEDGKRKSLTFMLKVSLNSPVMQALMKQNLFDIELTMYTDIVPELERILHDVGVDVKFGAQFYQLEMNNKVDYILLEDLRPRGFKNANRQEGLDIEHTKSVLKKLAQWHAASATRVATKGRYAEQYNHGYMLEINKNGIQGMYDSVKIPFFECLKSYKGNEVYGESVIKLHHQLVEELFKLETIDDSEFNVLNHGDCWSNNIMFRYDDTGTLQETYLVDFQIPKYGSPAIDLYYFLLSSTQFELKLTHFDYFVRYYYDNLVQHLETLKYPKKLPTLKDIHSALIKHGVLGYSVAISIMSAVLLEPNKDANIDSYLSNDESGNAFKIEMLSAARYRKHIEAILPWLYNRGALEINN